MRGTTSTTFRLFAAASVLVAAALPLSGCLYAQIPTSAPPIEDPTVDPVPTDDPTDEPIDEPSGDLPSTMTFADGALLPATAYIEWGDGLMMADGWESVKPDDGNGGWTYGTTDGVCTAQFWQGYISDVPVIAGDDSASSDAMLGVLVNTTADQITPYATTGAFGYQIGGSGGVDNRQVNGQEGERMWVMAARAFTATGVGVYVIVDCASGDANTVLAEVVEKNSILITP